ncbi:hypothetical protein V2J09_017011 [Rumex salicifolius]
MAAAYAAAARSLIRSSTARTATSRIATAASKPKAAPSPFRRPSQNLLSSPRILRPPVELSCCVDSLRPYHTATASALLTSLLSATPRCYGWTLEDIFT